MYFSSGSTYQNICVFKVVPPVWPNLPLSTDIPDVQFEITGLDTFNVEALEKLDTNLMNEYL